MLKFMYDHKGSLSLFTLFLLIPILVLSGLLMDLARAKSIEAQASAAAETYANSYLSVYDEMLNELYGLFAVTQADTKPLEELEKYMKASFKPQSMNETGLSNSIAIDFLRTDYKNDNPLSLTGSALTDLNAAAGKPLVSGSNYDALQMQISEYTKFIGPTDVLYSSLKELLKPNSGFDAEKSKNEVEKTNKNFNRIKKKDKIDKLIGELNEKINVLFGAMKGYDDTIDDYYNSTNKSIPGVQGYATAEVYSYNRAADTVIGAFEELDSLAYGILMDIQSKESEETSDNTDDTDNSDAGETAETETDTSQYVLNDESIERIKKIYHLSNGSIFLIDLEDVGDCKEGYCAGTEHDLHDFTAQVKKGDVIGYNKNIKAHIDQYYIQDEYSPDDDISYSAADVKANREWLVECANAFQNDLNDIRSQLQALIEEIDADIATITDAEEKENTQKFLDGIKKDYDAILNLSPTAQGDPNYRKMWILANFDYSAFAEDFGEYAKQGEDSIKADFLKAFEFNEDIDPQQNIYRNEEIIFELYSEIDGFLTDLTEGETDYKQITENIQTWAAQKGNDIIRLTDDELKTEQYAITTNTLSAYYRKFDDEKNDRKQGSITYRELYETLKNWYSPTAEDEQKRNEIDGLTADIWKAIKELKFNNIELREGCKNKFIPTGKDGKDGDAHSEKTDLSDILEKDDDPLSKTDTSVAFVNKLMIILYDYGMFTCQTSDKTEDENDLVVTQKPISYQGIALAKETKDGEKFKYESSETNFLLYGELEYIFNGDKDPQKNMNAVRDSLAVIRFVPNYISTYSISEINAIINSVQTALAWCPPAAILAAQALRIALAGFETWCDLDLLYGGSSALLYKKNMNDLSFIEKLKETELGRTIFEKLKSYDEGGNLDKAKKSGSNGIKVNYCQYLVLLEMIFVKRDDMVKRTADLINVNMNFVIDGSKKIEEGEDKDKYTVGLDKFKLSEANTAVTVTVNVKRDFVFTGGVFNVKQAGYDDAAELADKMNSDDNIYRVTITREY